MGYVLALVCALSVLLAPLSAVAVSPDSGDCQLTLGFKILHDLIPAIVGDCVEDVHYNGSTGDAQQMTTKGLPMVLLS